jgi:hypothetical protein
MSYVKYYPIYKVGKNEHIVDLDHLERFGKLKPFIGFYVNYYDENNLEEDSAKSLKFYGLGTGDFKADVKTVMDSLGLDNYDFLEDCISSEQTDTVKAFIDGMEKLGYKYIKNDITFGIMYIHPSYEN